MPRRTPPTLPGARVAAALRRWRRRARRLAPAAAPPPAPFVVGVARSGTTLLRLLIDAHPDVAIPPETGWGLVLRDLPPDADAERLLAAVTGLETWPDLGLERDDAARLFAAVDPWSVGGGLRALYREYAARRGKPRWGDKTPVHVQAMDAIAAVLPEARFVHLIRDGRDVAVSLRGLPFAPGDGRVEAIAELWRDSMAAAQAVAPRLAHYREVRYERLVAEPAAVLGELCEYLQLPFAPAMLRAHERAAARLGELPAVRRTGAGVMTRAERMALQKRTSHPPDPSRVGRWRRELAAADVARFEAVAGETLRALGYGTGPGMAPGYPA